MGVVLMLGIQYFVQLSHNSVPTSASIDRQTRLGPILVFLSILFNLIQTIMDMVRGWDVSSPLAPPNLQLTYLDVRLELSRYQSIRLPRLHVVRIPLPRFISSNDHPSLSPSPDHPLSVLTIIPLASS